MAGYAALAVITAFFVFGYLVAFDKYWLREIEWMVIVVAAWYAGRLIAYQASRTRSRDDGLR